MQRVFTHFVPAGAKMDPPEEVFEHIRMTSGNSKSSGKKKPKRRSLPENTSLDSKQPDFPDEQSKNSKLYENPEPGCSQSKYSNNKHKNPVNTPADISPPKVICKNRKNINIDDLDFKLCENSLFDVDLENITLPTPSNKNITIDAELDVTENEIEIITEQSPKVKTELTFREKLLQLVSKNKNSEQFNNSSSSSGLDNSDKEHETSDSSENYHSCSSEQTNVKNTSQNLNIQKSDDSNSNSWLYNNVKFNNEIVLNKNVPFFKDSNGKNSLKLTKCFNSDILIHGFTIPKPVKLINEAYFNDNINDALQFLKYTSATKMQSYMWPAIQRGLNVFMIGSHKSGKTLSYLPCIYTFIMDTVETYEELSKYEGPLCVILCANEKKCSDIYDLASKLTGQSWEDDVVSVTILTNAVKEKCDILITTALNLEKALKTEQINLKRLSHLILEDANVLLKCNGPFLGQFLKVVSEMQKNRPHSNNVQLIASSEQWTSDLDVLMQRLYTSPIVCFENFLDAALYGNIVVKKKSLSNLHRKFYLADVLKSHYTVHRSIIFCDEDEMSDIKEYLEMKGIECISISNDLIEDEIFENEDMWCSLTVGRYKVLLCTDALFEKTVHNFNANWIFHYSYPSSWKIFQNRFRSVLENIASFDSNSNSDICTFLLVTEDKKFVGGNFFNDFLNSLIINGVNHLKLE